MDSWVLELVSMSNVRVGFVVASRKHGKKEPQSFSHSGSFDHPGLQSLNNYKILFSIFLL